MGKVTCECCRKKCKGQAIKLPEDKYFHLKCFKCKECSKQLSSSAFFSKNGLHYCAEDYQRLFGTRCHTCGKYVEGEVVTALGNTYHQECFHCAKCGKYFGAGDKVTYNGKDYLCRVCLDKLAPGTKSPIRGGGGGGGDEKENVESPSRSSYAPSPPPPGPSSSNVLRPQQIPLVQGQMNSPDSDYSTDIKDYMSDGHVPDSSRSPLSPISVTSGYKSDASYDHADSRGYLTPGSQQFVHCRSVSPAGSALSHSKDSNGSIGSRRGELHFGKFFRTSYLEKKDDFKRGPSINPLIKEKPPLHYHRPDGFSYRKVRTDIKKPTKKGFLQIIVTNSFLPMRRNSEPYRPIKTQEPIQLSKLPDAHRQEKSHLLPIERDDFPAPPAPAAAYPELLREHRHRRKSGSGSIQGDLPNDIDTNDDDDDEGERKVDPKIEKEIMELSKIPDSGAAQIILEGLKKKKHEPLILDPRSASRTPSASVEPPYKTRYESSIFASPSRDLELRAHLPTLDDAFAEPKYRTCSTPVAPYLVHRRFYGMPREIVHSYPVPRPGYNLRSEMLDSRNGFLSDVSDSYYLGSYYPRRPGSSSAVLEHSSYYSSQSDLEEYDPTTGLRRNTRLRSSVMPDGRITPISFLGHRKSVGSIFKLDEPPRTYTYDELRLSNRRRPAGLDKDRLEEYLSKEEFERLFQMAHEDFYHLAEWKRNDMKMRVELF